MARAIAPRDTHPAAPEGIPRLLLGSRSDRSLNLDEHIEQHGAVPLAGGRRDAEALIDLVEQSGLRGCGGAGFPTATKLRTVALARRRPSVLANGCEGEPASQKDAVLLTTQPHLVLDGAVFAASVVGAREVVVAVDRIAVMARRAVAVAISQRSACGLDHVAIRLVDPPSRYVAGEESALIHWLNGGDAKPTAVPPRPFERGFHGRPTLVQNVETLAHLALIARFGADWYRSLGTAEEPGTALVTLSGAIARPGVYEVPLGTTLRTLVGAAGGATQEVAAFLIGGYFGSWITAAKAWDLPLTRNDLRRAGATFGAGVIVAFPTHACGIADTARVTRYLAQESAGQCGPCVYGLAAIADALESVTDGRNVHNSVAHIRRWTMQVRGRGACHFPDGAAQFVESALRAFEDDVALHGDRGSCADARRLALLPLPEAQTREWGWR